MSYINIIRPLNLAIIGLTQFILYYIIFYPAVDHPALNHIQFILLSVTTMLIAAGGYVINDIYDYQADIINKPDKTWIERSIPITNAWKLYYGLLSLGFVIALYLALVTENLPLLSLYPGSCILLWWYAHDLKKQGWGGNLVVAIMTAFVSLILVVAERKTLLLPENQHLMILFTGFSWFSFLVNLAREWVKDLQDREGDLAIGSRSLPIKFGVTPIKKMAVLCLLITVASIVTFIFNYPHSFHQQIFAVVFVIAPFLKVMVQILKSRDANDFKKSASALKMLMFLGLVYLILFSPLLITYGIAQ